MPHESKAAPWNAVLGLAAALVALCVVARLLPHPPNFAPTAAIALFAGVLFSRHWQSGLVVLLGMGLSDWLLGFYDAGVMLTVYVSLLLPIAARRFLGAAPTIGRVAAAGLAAGIGFYLTTNAAVWYFTTTYPPTLDGLVASYVAGLPFLKWTIAGNLFWCGVLFGGHRLFAYNRPTQAVSPRLSAPSVTATGA